MGYNFDELNTVNIWNIYDKVRKKIWKCIQICGWPMAEYEHFKKVIIIYKLIIQYILWIPTLRHYKPRRKYVEECGDIT